MTGAVADPGSCPSEALVVGFLDGTTSADERAAVELHIDRCEECRRLLAILAGSLETRSAGELTTEVHARGGESPELPRGAVIGRFVTLDRVGAGGMGVVYAAYDPELDRKLAIKLLHPGVAAEGGAGRLQREAQAMARLSHENVITVYEVGSHGGQVFLAMELCAGPTLHDWLTESPRPWREVVRRFVQAGRGIAAAHAAGVVHRDFKPHNVLAGEGSRMRVTDFGLAFWDEASAPPALSPAMVPRTATGAVVGTLAYMAPEQLTGGRADEKSDQFSFCVSLWEALCGQRPFAGADAAGLLASIEAGEIRDPRRGIPARLIRQVRRGLAAALDARHPSMTALVAALERELARNRRRVALAVATVAAVAAAAFAAGRGGESDSPCPRPLARLAGVWDGQRQAAVRGAFVASGAADAPGAFDRVARAFDGYGGAWLDHHVEACRATRVSGHQSEALLDLRIGCLDDRRRDWKALVDLFAEADRDVVVRAAEAALKLPDLEGCSHAAALTAVVPPPPDPAAAAMVAAGQEAVAAVRAMYLAGKLTDGIGPAGAAVQKARATGHAPLVADALAIKGTFELSLDQNDAAERDLNDAVVAGLAGRHHVAVARAWLGLALLLGGLDRRHQEGLRVARQAEAMLDATGETGKLRGTLHEVRGQILTARSPAMAEAGVELEKSVAAYARALGPDHLHTQSARLSLAVALSGTDRAAEAPALGRAALAGLSASLGPEHPFVVDGYRQLSGVLAGQGEHAAAIELGEKARALFERQLGPRHVSVGRSLLELGRVHEAAGDAARALAAFRGALDIFEANDREHPLVAIAKGDIAEVLAAGGQYAEALPLAEQSLALLRRTMVGEHQDIGWALNAVCLSLVGLGRYEAAVPRHRELVAMTEKLFGPEHPEVIHQLSWYAYALDLAGRPAEALRTLARAEPGIRRTHGENSSEMAVYFNQVGHGHLELEHGREALAAYEKGLAIEKALGQQDRARVADHLTGIGRARLLLGRRSAAALALEQASRLRAEAPAVERAETQFALARAIWQKRGSRARARSLAGTARSAYAAAHNKREVQRIDRWLARHRK